MDSERNQPLVNNVYPTIENNNPGWNQPPQNSPWVNNPNPAYNANLPYNPNAGYNPNPGYNTNPVFNPNPGYNPNPGFNPNLNNNFPPPPNQGFNNNMPPPNYGGQQPLMPGQQPMPNLNQEKIIIIREHSSMPCHMCGFDGMSTWRQTAGCAAYSWCICLFCFFWPLFWVPFCMDSCYDTEVICSRCGQTKGKIQADCC